MRDAPAPGHGIRVQTSPCSGGVEALCIYFTSLGAVLAGSLNVFLEATTYVLLLAIAYSCSVHSC